MPFVKKGGGGQEDDGGGGFGLGEDFDPLACPVCRRELLPWQDTCPEHDAEGVHRSELPPVEDPLLARLLAEEEAEDTGNTPEP